MQILDYQAFISVHGVHMNSISFSVKPKYVGKLIIKNS
jgi:hypothetical protein